MTPAERVSHHEAALREARAQGDKQGVRHHAALLNVWVTLARQSALYKKIDAGK